MNSHSHLLDVLPSVPLRLLEVPLVRAISRSFAVNEGALTH
ncbi:hypothetical protein [Nitrobacter sp. JJSN]